MLHAMYIRSSEFCVLICLLFCGPAFRGRGFSVELVLTQFNPRPRLENVIDDPESCWDSSQSWWGVAERPPRAKTVGGAERSGLRLLDLKGRIFAARRGGRERAEGRQGERGSTVKSGVSGYHDDGAEKKKNKTHNGGKKGKMYPRCQEWFHPRPES